MCSSTGIIKKTKGCDQVMEVHHVKNRQEKGNNDFVRVKKNSSCNTSRVANKFCNSTVCDRFVYFLQLYVDAPY